jgi:hypothetical protein
MKPTGERIALADRTRFPGENEKGRLACVLGVVLIPQDAPANAEDKTAVSFHDCRECDFIMACNKPLQQLPVWKFFGLPRSHRTQDVAEDVIKLRVAHELSPTIGA